MAEKYTFTNEAKVVFNYIKKDLVSQFPTEKISSYYYIYSVLSNKDCLAYKALEKLFFTESLNSLENDCYAELSNAVYSPTGVEPKYDNIYDEVLEKCNEKGTVINSCLFLDILLLVDENSYKVFKKYGITASQIESVMESTIAENGDTVADTQTKEKRKPKSKQKKETENTPKAQPTSGKYPENTDVEKNLIDLNKMAISGKLDKAIGNGEIIDKIFTALLKRDKNNVILVGESGCGKTCTVQHIANMIVDGDVPKYFKDKKLMKMDFISLTSGTGFRGGFESKYQNIIETAAKSGRYIFFIDDINSILSPNSKFTEVATDVMLEDILNNKNIMFICTTTHDNYSKYIEPNKNLVRRFEKIVLTDKDGKDKFDIIKKVAAKYEKYHFVTYSDDVITTAINLSQRFFGNADIYTVSDILDTAAATELMKVKNDDNLDKLVSELIEIQNKIDEIKTKSDSESYEKYDELCADEVKKKSEINLYEKKMLSEKKPLPVTLKSLYECVSKKTDIPVGEIGKTELEKLKNIDSRLKEKVIGQDEAVEILCKAVRRQRVGLGNPDKPVVCLMSGTSGCGKTFLAKKLAEEVFGSEKNMVRLDMSEYADKTSINKIHGCFTPDMGVLMASGEYKPIKDVVPGDKVITPNGNIKEVAHVWTKHYDGVIDVYRIGNSNYEIECTPNHDILSCKGEYYKNGHINKKKTYLKENIQFRHSYELQKKDVVLYPKEIKAEEKDIVYDLSKYITCNRQYRYNDNVIWNKAQGNFCLQRFVKFDEKLARILGYYVSEGGGHANEKSITFTFSSHEKSYVDELYTLIQEVFGRVHVQIKYNIERNRCDVRVSNRCLCRFFKDLCGRTVYIKHIPYDIINRPKSVQINFIETAFLGDGTKTTINATRYTTVSKQLADGIQCLLRNNGMLSQLNYRMNLMKDKKTRKPVYHIYITGNSIDVWNSKMPNMQIARVNDGAKGIIRFAHIDSYYYYNRIISKSSKEYCGLVYDLTISDDSAYIVNGMAVHNSSPGYVGYDEGGLLTEAIKKNNHCVLLLDEIEKANEEIYNTFLQVFDEGRLTDNKGTTVDFRNVIILMTSNIGTKEAANKKPLIGFGDKDEDMRDKDIILSTIKKKLPPEFINRIDEIMFMNKLTDDNLKTIINIEIRKIEERVEKLGYGFDKSIFEGELPKNIFKEVKKESEYGARPILRELRRQLEDKLTDYLLENTPKKGYKIKYSDIYNESSDK